MNKLMHLNSTIFLIFVYNLGVYPSTNMTSFQNYYVMNKWNMTAWIKLFVGNGRFYISSGDTNNLFSMFSILFIGVNIL